MQFANSLFHIMFISVRAFGFLFFYPIHSNVVSIAPIHCHGNVVIEFQCEKAK